MASYRLNLPDLKAAEAGWPKEDTAMRKAIRPPLRFPRLLTAGKIGELTRKIWRRPKFSVREVHSATEFVHHWPFRFPERIRSKESAAFYTLFSSETIDIKREIKRAYRKATYKGLPVRRLIDGALQATFITAMREIFMRAKQSDARFGKYLKGGPVTFATAARPRRKPKVRLRNRRAIHLTRLYDEVLPSAKEILSFLTQHDRKNQEDLKRDLENEFPKRLIFPITRGAALLHLPDIPGYDTRQTLSELKSTPRQLAIGIVWALKENSRGNLPALGPDTILEDYLPLGRELLRKGSSTKRS